MAAVLYNHFGAWSRGIETAESTQQAWHCSDYNVPISSSLFGFCLRYFALEFDEDVTCLPKSIIEKIEMLRHDMIIACKMHERHLIFKLSWIGVGKYGNVDWPRTYTRCYHEMPPDDFFVFAAINGIATRVSSHIKDLELKLHGLCFF